MTSPRRAKPARGARPSGRAQPPSPATSPGPVQPPSPATPPEHPRGGLDLALRIAGGVVCTGLAAASAVYEAFLTPLYWHTVRVPLSLVLAVAGNAGLAWLTRYLTGRTGAVLAPAGVWTLLMFAAAVQTSEGDLVLNPTNWVAIGTLTLGSLTFAVSLYRQLLAPLHEVHPPR